VLHAHPWDEWALASQFVALAIAPVSFNHRLMLRSDGLTCVSQAFLAAGIYLTLKHVMLSISPQSSIIRPKFYTWIFISCDAVSIIIQAVAGAVASTATTNGKISANASNIALLVGICFQVFTLLIFGVMAGLYAHNVSRDRHALGPAALSLLRSRQLRKFVFAMSLAYLVILIRCVYRIGEVSGGWKNSISRNQVGFMILDGL